MLIAVHEWVDEAEWEKHVIKLLSSVPNSRTPSIQTIWDHIIIWISKNFLVAILALEMWIVQIHVEIFF